MIENLVIFGKEIPWYGICFFFGAAIAVVAAMILCKFIRFPSWEIIYSAIFMMVGAVIGAKVLFWIVSYKDIAAQFEEAKKLGISAAVVIENIIKGGFVFYGGLLGGLAGIWIYTKKYKVSIRPYLDVYAVVLPLGHAFGRVGCFLAGCCYGMPCSVGFEYRYPVSSLTPTGVKLFPIQLVEAACLLILFGVQLLVLRKRRFSGQCAVFYCWAYPLVRFTLEFFRGDAERGGFLFLSTSQWICLLLAGGATALLILGRKKGLGLIEVTPDGSQVIPAPAEAVTEDSPADASAADEPES